MADREIGNYIANDIIGQGAYSIVYRGLHRDLNRPVAIKMMCHNLALDQRTDIYALGITGFEIITGRRPFPEDDARALLDMHRECEIPDLWEMLPSCPRPLRDFIMKACRRSPDERYQDASEALKDLQRIGEEIGLPGRIPRAEPLNMASLFLVYQNHQQSQFKELMDKIRAQAKELGISIKATDFPHP